MSIFYAPRFFSGQNRKKGRKLREQIRYLYIYIINGTIFGKKLLNIKSVFWFSLRVLSEIFLILRRIQQDIITIVIRKLLGFCHFFNKNLILSAYLRKILKYQISWKSVHCDRWCSVLSHRQMNCQLVRQTWRRKQSLLVILRMCLKTRKIRDIK
jgi:hypothetical protein